MNLPFDIILHIASLNCEVWLQLALVFKEFGLWTLSNQGKRISDCFCTVVTDGKNIVHYKGKRVHRLNDPAVIMEKGRYTTLEYYLNGKLHCYNGKPFRITKMEGCREDTLSIVYLKYEYEQKVVEISILFDNVIIVTEKGKKITFKELSYLPKKYLLC